MGRRILALVLTLLALGGTFVAPSLLPKFAWLTMGQNPGSLLTKVKARDLMLVCPGAAFATGGKSGTSVSSFVRDGSAIVDYASNLPSGVTLRSLPLEGPAANASHLADTAKQVATVATVSALAVTVSDPLGSAQQSSSLFTAQSFQSESGATINGLLGANCQNPSAETLLIGGVTTTGREALLVLANPSATDATVSLKLYGETGLIDGGGLNGISVSAFRTVVVPLSGFAPDQKSITVKVDSSGASIASWIQERTTRGTVSAGADLISPSILAAKKLVIPGLLKRGTAGAKALIAANADYQDLTPSVQIYVPGAKDASVTVQVIGSDAKSLGTVLQQTVTAGTIQSFDITGIGDGDYSVFVQGDQPVVAAVKLSRASQKATPNSDFAWLPAVAPMTTPVAAAVPQSGVAKVSIANGGGLSANVTVTNLTDGSQRSVVISPLGSKVLALPAGAEFAVSADQPVSATMVADFTGMISAFGMQDYSNSGGTMSVTVR